ncbi:MAG TPA: dihydrodipicolinate synthase family protein [Nocardioides sp.]|jgi:dihydrodipicolinate synthase/N-acetylneuraminate lyase|uniref:dihydrodipicolinate synthase family protein n=1 Tax=Nocardioides sp. TaxID=35761 RepID=UPI002E33E9EF|nr:dihydrodipicolinate synthase family protein [Nocardioides sp.]HEX3931823.1 dihydrodipicolinate synthase family protein [Nocardioides sp.]
MPHPRIFSGVAVALTTLFDDSLEVDAQATGAHARRLVDAGMRAIVVCGTTGEPETLSPSEKLQVLEAVLDAVAGDVPVVMGVTEPSGRQAAESAASAVGLVGGEMAGVLARSPRGVPDPTDFYSRIHAAIGPVPLLAYHFPAVAPPGIPLNVLAGLPVVGHKDSSGDPERLLAALGVGGDIYVGASTLLLMAGAVGCAGAILQLANAAPEQCLQAFAGDADAQRALVEGHLRAKGDFPRGVKTLMHERFGTSPAFRLR